MRQDPHSYNDDTQGETESFHWRARFDFAARVLSGQVTFNLREPATTSLDLDTRDLTIEGVTTDDGQVVPFSLAPPDVVLGTRLSIALPRGTKRFTVTYRTAPTASALQWLTPAQTAGGKHPFLFSQCQAIHARSVLPLQDTPRMRVKYTAELDVPAELKSLMAAADDGRSQGAVGRAVDRWHMPQPIPPYLIAFAVGDLASRELGPRSRVWAEPSVVDKAAWEFAGVDVMLKTGENLFGPYDWERFDILTMPPSFSYGGMENPRLTFLTPTLLAGDRSLVNVVAHELAHSWTGNLITNASAEHFWLNEGWTVYAERRIGEALGGVDDAALHAALGRRSLDRAVARFAKQPELTHLRTHLTGIDPDEAFSEVPYEKGFLFLRTIEEAVGRARFDAFVRLYVSRFRFGALTTDDFLAFVEKELPGVLSKINASAWIDGPGVPDNAPAPRSRLLEAIGQWQGRVPPEEVAQRWAATEWQLYLESQQRPFALCAELDERFSLTAKTNYDVLVAWLELASESGYAPATARIEEVLGEVGRMKYLKPLFRELARRPETTDIARRCFARYKDGYHPIARQVIESLL